MIGTKNSLNLEPDDQAGLAEKGVLDFSNGSDLLDLEPKAIQSKRICQVAGFSSGSPADDFSQPTRTGVS